MSYEIEENAPRLAIALVIVGTAAAVLLGAGITESPTELFAAVFLVGLLVGVGGKALHLP